MLLHIVHRSLLSRFRKTALNRDLVSDSLFLKSYGSPEFDSVMHHGHLVDDYDERIRVSKQRTVIRMPEGPHSPRVKESIRFGLPALSRPAQGFEVINLSLN